MRRTATVGGNIVGSTLRCLLPPALVLNARATVMDGDGTYEAELAEVVAKRPDARHPLAPSARQRLLEGPRRGGRTAAAGGRHRRAHGGGRRARLLTAVRDGDEAVSASVPATADAGRVLDDLEGTALGGLPGEAWDAIRREVTDILGRA